MLQRQTQTTKMQQRVEPRFWFISHLTTVTAPFLFLFKHPGNRCVWRVRHFSISCDLTNNTNAQRTPVPPSLAFFCQIQMFKGTHTTYQSLQIENFTFLPNKCLEKQIVIKTTFTRSLVHFRAGWFEKKLHPTLVALFTVSCLEEWFFLPNIEPLAFRECAMQ